MTVVVVLAAARWCWLVYCWLAADGAAGLLLLVWHALAPEPVLPPLTPMQNRSLFCRGLGGCCRVLGRRGFILRRHDNLRGTRAVDLFLFHFW